MTEKFDAEAVKKEKERGEEVEEDERVMKLINYLYSKRFS